MSGLSLHLLALLVLLVLSGFFSGAEAALFSLGRTRVRELADGSLAGRSVSLLLEKPRRILVTILLGNLVVNVFATSAATALCLDLFGRRGLGVAFVGMSVLLLAFGEVLPKTVALRWKERVALRVVVPLRAVHLAVYPIRVPLAAFADASVALLRRWVGVHSKSFTHEELVTALRIGRDEGNVGEFEYEVLARVLRFRHKVVREIMTPSIDVLAAHVSSTRTELLERFGRSGKSRIPIYDESPDHIVGVLHIKDLVPRQAAATESDLRTRLREPFFVQELTPIDSLYNSLQAQKAHFAVVLDEYSSFAGVVTIEDILEELVGEIRDARDPKTTPWMKIDDCEIVVEGSMELGEFNEVFGVHIEDDLHETVAGFLLGVTGRIPRSGEIVEAEGLRFQILRAQPNRIRKIRVEKI